MTATPQGIQLRLTRRRLIRQVHYKQINAIADAQIGSPETNAGLLSAGVTRIPSRWAPHRYLMDVKGVRRRNFFPF
jgi:hypothetical protein